MPLSRSQQLSGGKLAMAVSIASGIKELWENKTFLDFTLKVGDQEFRVHKAVIAAGSDFFKQMLSGQFKESKEDTVELESLSQVAMKELLQFMYTGEMALTRENIFEVLAGAVLLQINPAMESCCAFLGGMINSDNCYSLLELVKSYGIRDLDYALTDKILDCNEDIVNSDVVMGMSFAAFSAVRDAHERSYGDPSDEMSKFSLIENWIMKDVMGRQSHMDTLVRNVNFIHIPPHDLKEIQQKPIYSIGDHWKRSLLDALVYPELPVWKKVLEYNTMIYNTNSEPTLVAFTPKNSYHDKECAPKIHYLSEGQFDRNTKERWLVKDLGPQTCGPLMGASVTIVNDFIIVAGGRDQNAPGGVSDKCFIFDPKQLMWYPIASMNSARVHFPLIGSDDMEYAFGGRPYKGSVRIYALGGCVANPDDKNPQITAECESYDFSTNTWSSMASMRMPLRCHAAFYSFSHIFVCGGLGAEDVDPTSCEMLHKLSFGRLKKQPMRCLQMYDVPSGVWTMKAPMIEPRYDHVFTLMERAVVGDAASDYLMAIGPGQTMEYYDAEEDRWTSYEPDFDDENGRDDDYICIPVRGYKVRFGLGTVDFLTCHMQKNWTGIRFRGDYECSRLTFGEKGSRSRCRELPHFSGEVMIATNIGLTSEWFPEKEEKKEEDDESEDESEVDESDNEN